MKSNFYIIFGNAGKIFHFLTFLKLNINPQKLHWTIWWWCNWVINFGFLENGQTIMTKTYAYALKVTHKKDANILMSWYEKKDNISAAGLYHLKSNQQNLIELGTEDTTSIFCDHWLTYFQVLNAYMHQ